MKYNANEIFEIAIQIEKNGYLFYSRCAEKSADLEIKRLLNGLAQAEIRHEETFTAMKNNFIEKSENLAPVDPDEEALAYLQSMASGYIFNAETDLAKTMTGSETPKEILKFALGREKDSVVFYVGMKEMVPESLGRKHLDKIIQEEMNHVGVISKFLAKLG
ncbi:MAG: ferritin family protein [Candidatus Auribacterota bacterium]|jgi:rubrerythrin